MHKATVDLLSKYPDAIKAIPLLLAIREKSLEVLIDTRNFIYREFDFYWDKQGIEFIWITDGAGWQSTLKPLREYFDKADYLLNLEMLRIRKGILKRILI